MKILVVKTKEDVSTSAMHEAVAEWKKSVDGEGIILLNGAICDYEVIDIDRVATSESKAKNNDPFDALTYVCGYNTRKAEPSYMEAVKKINRCFGIGLFDWQIDYIFNNTPTPREISFSRRAGKTFAAALKLCLSKGEPLDLRKNEHFKTNSKAYDILFHYADEDKHSLNRLRLFCNDLEKVYRKLAQIDGMELREIYF